MAGLGDAFNSGGQAYAPGELLVKFDAGVDPLGVVRPLSSIGANVGETLRQALGGEGALARVSLPVGLDPTSAADLLSHLPGVAYAEPNYVYTTQATSNDPAYTGGQLWGMYGDQTTPANAYGSQAGEAWAAGFTGSTKVAVGIVDTGIDYTHPDLYRNIWLNQGEIPTALRSVLADTDGDGLITFRDLNAQANAASVSDLNGNGRIDAGDLLQDSRWENGADNDGNGYVDDLVGWDFVNNDNDPYDDNSHGSHVAGTIGATGGDGTGVAGVNWAVQMIALKFLDSGGSGTSANATKALDYLTNVSKVAAGVDVAASNNSWGGDPFSQTLLDAIVRGAKQDILFVAAAGNGGWDGRGDNNDTTAFYPANYSTVAGAGYEAVISVAAITSTGALASFSNYGPKTVDLGAPGNSIYSTVPGGYGTKSGTSMAAPHVTGALALYTAAEGAGMSAADIRAALLQATSATSALNGKVVTGGRLDLSKLLSAPVDPTPQQSAAISSAADDVAPLTGTLTNGAFTNDASPTLNGSLSAPLAAGQRLVLFRDGTDIAHLTPAGTSWTFTDSGLTEGAHAWTARVVDGANLQGPLSAAFGLTLDLTAPGQTAAIVQAQDNVGTSTGALANGAVTDDLTPLLGGTLSAALASGETLAVYRDGARLGLAQVSGTNWSYQDTVAGAGTYSWQVRVEDAAGNVGGYSSAFGLTMTAPPNEIYGTRSSDNIFGTDGADKIWGVPATGTDLGKGDIDRLTGLGGGDVFVLGDARGRFYDDGRSTSAGTTDYGLIQDFTPGGDKIQLAGAAARYFTAPVTLSGVAGLGIYYDTNLNGAWDSRDELIGLVRGQTSLDAASFIYV